MLPQLFLLGGLFYITEFYRVSYLPPASVYPHSLGSHLFLNNRASPLLSGALRTWIRIYEFFRVIDSEILLKASEEASVVTPGQNERVILPLDVASAHT